MMILIHVQMGILISKSKKEKAQCRKHKRKKELQSIDRKQCYKKRKEKGEKKKEI